MNTWRVRMTRIAEKIWFKIAWLLPKRLIYFAGIRLIAHATTGKWRTTNARGLKAMETLDRWPR